VDAVATSECRADSLSMRLDASNQPVCHTDINCAVWLARENVSEIRTHGNIPLRSECASPWMPGTRPGMTN
jgi:hypothetical protein